MTLIQAIAEVFKYKIVGSIIVLACWSPFDRVNFSRELSKHGMITTFSCDPAILDHTDRYKLQGVLYMPSKNVLLHKIKREYFTNWCRWVIVGDSVPDIFQRVRYDAEILLIKPPTPVPPTPPSLLTSDTNITNSLEKATAESIYVYDVYIHPRDDARLFPLAVWTEGRGLQITHSLKMQHRRRNLLKYPLRIATPIGSYTEEVYNATFKEYLLDMSIRERDSAVRCGYSTSSLIIELLNATEVLVPTLLWSTEVNNSSMMVELRYGLSELSGSTLRMMHERFEKVDYTMTIWPFHVGFSYLADRESSSNMFMEPFTVTVWWCTLGLFLVQSLAQRITAKSPMEKEGAYIAALATYLQQDASAVPDGVSGRWTFLVLSISAMLIHTYYTSAIVAALMSAGRSGPDSLRALGDSKFAIASEDYDYIRYLMFDVETNQEDLEYLKKKKMTPNFYQDIKRGVELIAEGHTAYHAEYNQLYPHLKTFTDDQICKMQQVDTIPAIPSWVTTTKHGQWTSTFRTAGAWLHETGLAKRLVDRLRILAPPCRAALLAERVNMDDVAPVVIFSVIGVFTSLFLLAAEIFIAKCQRKRNVAMSETDLVETEDFE